MSQKTELPTLSGHRIKTRKRDEKEKYDPAGFRDAILQGFNETGSDFEKVSKFLDTAGSKLDYRRYGETLFDILLAGGILAPGGSIAPESTRSEVIVKLIRRYKYLEKTLDEEFKKIFMFLKNFTPEQRTNLAKVTALLLSGGQISTGVLAQVLQEHLVKDGVALEFIIEVFQTWITEKDSNAVWSSLRKVGLDNKLLEFLPVTRRTLENLTEAFNANGLSPLSNYIKANENKNIKKELQQQVVELLNDAAPMDEIIAFVKDQIKKTPVPEHEVGVLVWMALMSIVDWNKRQELVQEQAIKHLRQYTTLLATFTTSTKAELALMVKIQEYCYDNIAFMKAFEKILVLFYKNDVWSEDAILKWYRDAHSSKGKGVFLEQTRKFVEWLQNAEEESEEED